MRKKELKKLPCEAPDWMIKKAGNSEKWVFLLRRRFGTIQTYEFYEVDNLRKGGKNPIFIVFRAKNEWINYIPEEDSWTTAKFGNASFPKEEVTGKRYYATYYFEQYDVLMNLERWQNKIGEKKLKAQRRQEEQKVKDVMSLVPELPEDFEDFIKNNLMKNANYIIYSRKKNKAHCTGCEENYTVDDLEITNSTQTSHMKEYQMCPKCGRWLKQISEGISRRDKGFAYGTEIMQSYENGVAVREFNVYRSFKGNSAEMSLNIVETHRFIFTNGKYKEYEKCVDKWEDRTGKQFKIVSLTNGKCYREDVSETVRQSEMFFDGAEKLVQKWINEHEYREGMEKPLRWIMQKPWTEQLVKAGFVDLAYREMQHQWEFVIHKDQTKLTKMLGITKEQMRILKKQTNQETALGIMQMAAECNVNLTENVLARLIEYKGQRNSLRELMETGINLEKAIKYISKNEISIGDFVDHLKLIKKLDIQNNKNNRYPKDFRRFHQQEIEEDMLKNDTGISKETNKQFVTSYKQWKQLIKKNKITTESEHYTIYLPPDAVDIKIEGRVLHHCVGNYVENAATKKCLIFYVRKTKEDRLYTAEYKNGKLVQIRARSNGSAEDEARELAERFAMELREAEKKES